jgi:hypothetical protein
MKLQSSLRSPKYTVPFKVSRYNFVCIYLLRATCPDIVLYKNDQFALLIRNVLLPESMMLECPTEWGQTAEHCESSNNEKVPEIIPRSSCYMPFINAIWKIGCIQIELPNCCLQNMPLQVRTKSRYARLVFLCLVFILCLLITLFLFTCLGYRGVLMDKNGRLKWIYTVRLKINETTFVRFCLITFQTHSDSRMSSNEYRSGNIIHRKKAFLWNL